MAQLGDRLVRCISSVFPTLSDDEIRAADVAVLMDMDSLAGVTLLAVIGDEFGIEMDLERLMELGSLPALCRYVHEAALAGALRETGE